jgi:hypothetical protein
MAGPHLNKDLESRSDAGWLPTETAPERRPLPRLGTAGSVMKALGTADRRGVRVAERSRIDGLALGAPAL